MQISLFLRKKNRRSVTRKAVHREVRVEKLHRIRLVEEGEGKVKAEFKGWVNFCQSREDSSFTSGILKNHLNVLVRPFMGYPRLFVHTSILLCKLCKCS